jgi:thiol-disulfide isomerase/thioredoxin
LELAQAVKKLLFFLVLSATCLTVAFRYFRPGVSITDADDEHGAVADIDQLLPHAVLPSLSGDWADLSTYKGQVVLIAFWTTWCSGCVDEVPSLIHLQKEFGDKGFTVVAVAVDDDGKESVESFVRRQRFDVHGDSTPINYPVLLGSQESARKLGFEGGLPACVLVNREGREVKIFRGVLGESVFSRAIQKLVKN